MNRDEIVIKLHALNNRISRLLNLAIKYPHDEARKLYHWEAAKLRSRRNRLKRQLRTLNLQRFNS